MDVLIEIDDGGFNSVLGRRSGIQPCAARNSGRSDRIDTVVDSMCLQREHIVAYEAIHINCRDSSSRETRPTGFLRFVGRAARICRAQGNLANNAA
jgi:hypothetical protein